MRILLSEGASTSAREAITALGLRHHQIEVCDPDPHCLGRFSRFVRRVHRCPPMGRDPQGYLAFVLDLIAREPFDVLLPIHEQGLLLARARARVAAHVGVALPSFESYLRAHNKLGFSQLLTELDLTQPATQVVASAAELQAAAERCPVVVKTAIGTASRGTWIVREQGQLAQVLIELTALEGFAEPVLVQAFVDGEMHQAQGVFAQGRLLASHAYRQVARGAGGGSSLKESVRHPLVSRDLARIGERLQWHGALSLDYIVESKTGAPHYFDCNPRLVEPMSAVFAGIDLVDLLLQVSLGQPKPEALVAGRAGVRTHMALQALLGCAARDESRVSLLKECWRLFAKRDCYSGSREELTPVGIDWMSFVPTTVTALWLLARPRAAHDLPRRGWGSQLLTPDAIRVITAMREEP